MPTYITRIFTLTTILLTGLYVLSVQPAQADWDERQQGSYNDGVFIGRVAQCLQYNNPTQETAQIFFSFCEKIKQRYIDKYGEAYVNSQAYKSPVMTGMNVGVATQKQKYTRECDAIFVQFKNIADTIGFDIQLSNN
jgi:hypothetical protein